MDILRGADPINDELEVGFDERFESNWRYVMIGGRIVMLLFVLAALAGLLGQGPYSHDRVSNAAHTLGVDFEPVARSDTDTQITFHIGHASPDGTATLQVGSTMIEPMGLKMLLPQPAVSRPVHGGLALTYAVPPGERQVEVRLVVHPAAIGPVHLSAALAGEAPIRWTQVIVP